LEPELEEAALCERPRVADTDGEALLIQSAKIQTRAQGRLGRGVEDRKNMTAYVKGLRRHDVRSRTEVNLHDVAGFGVGG
jgi:hypothetical protein